MGVLGRVAGGVAVLGRRAGSVLRDGPQPPPRTPGRVLRSLVWVLAGWLGAFTAATVSQTASGQPLGAGSLLVGLLAAGPLLLVLTRPWLGWILSAAGALADMALSLDTGGSWSWPLAHGFVLLALLLAVGARNTPGRAVLAWIGTSLLYGPDTAGEQVRAWLLGVAAVAVIGLLVGRLARRSRELVVQAERGRVDKAQRMVLEERARIARDLHDVVAHHMSLVVVQAETAPYRRPELSPDARAEMSAIATVARTALSETRALLGVLRAEHSAPEHAPQPGVDDLAALVETARRAGTQVRSELDPQLGPVRSGTGLAVYRIVQEALANAARHAPGEPVELSVRRVGSGVRLRVSNVAAAAPGPAGYGIVGMRERARSEGGELTAERSADGHFRVAAALPLDDALPLDGAG